MIAVISDIHSNMAAIEAVLADIRRRGITRIFCLGDVVGYGPQPRESLDLVMENAETSLMGNHDYAVLYEPNKFNAGAEAACYWTRQQLEDEPDAQRRAARWSFLGSMPVKHVIEAPEVGADEIVFVHGSPRRPINEYLFPDDVFSNASRISGSFDRFNHLCFVGHTHVPGVFMDPPDFYTPDELKNVFSFKSGQKALINVGSVGQPRDRDPRASYVVVEPGKIEFIRVQYDVESMAQKVFAVPELDNYLGARLKEGR